MTDWDSLHAELEAKLTPGHPFFELIDKAFRIFAGRKPKSTEVCQQCCMDPEIEADFFNPPIRQLPLAYVRDWYSAAYEPPIAKETWGYLLPRVLEILAAGEEVASVGCEVSLNRFETGNPDHWSFAEWRILDRFQRHFLRSKLVPSDDHLDDFICMFGTAGWDVEELVRQVESAPDQVLADRFWNDWCKGVVPGRESIWVTSFWEGGKQSVAYEFYTGDGLLQRMQNLALGGKGDQLIAKKALAVASAIESARADPASVPN
jgi:hypothetical protein